MGCWDISLKLKPTKTFSSTQWEKQSDLLLPLHLVFPAAIKTCFEGASRGERGVTAAAEQERREGGGGGGGGGVGARRLPPSPLQPPNVDTSQSAPDRHTLHMSPGGRPWPGWSTCQCWEKVWKPGLKTSILSAVSDAWQLSRNADDESAPRPELTQLVKGWELKWYWS